MANKSGLKAWWSLDEESGTRTDSHGLHDLSVTGSVVSATGIVGQSAVFPGTGTDYLSAEYHADLHPGDNRPWSVTGWFKITGITTTPHGIIGSFWGLSRGWSFELITGGAPRFFLGTGGELRIASWGGTISANQWHFFHVFHDPGNVVGLSINNGPAVTTAAPGIVTANVNPLYVGVRRPSNIAMTGNVDELDVWNKLLATDDLSDLYNGGAGIGYGDLSSGLVPMPLLMGI